MRTTMCTVSSLATALNHPADAFCSARRSWDVLVENFLDPSHVPNAHHGVQGDRCMPSLLVTLAHPPAVTAGLVLTCRLFANFHDTAAEMHWGSARN